MSDTRQQRQQRRTDSGHTRASHPHPMQQNPNDQWCANPAFATHNPVSTDPLIGGMRSDQQASDGNQLYPTVATCKASSTDPLDSGSRTDQAAQRMDLDNDPEEQCTNGVVRGAWSGGSQGVHKLVNTVAPNAVLTAHNAAECQQSRHCNHCCPDCCNHHCPASKYAPGSDSTKKNSHKGSWWTRARLSSGSEEHTDGDTGNTRSSELSMQLKQWGDQVKSKDTLLAKKDEEISKLEKSWQEWFNRLKFNHDRDLANARQENDAKVDKMRQGHAAEIKKLGADLADWKSNADNLGKQLALVEQSNSKISVSTGAHKDSPAIPPNLENAVTLLKNTALQFTKMFISSMSGWGLLDGHEALNGISKLENDKLKRYVVQAFICRRLFAGFENDSYYCEESSTNQIRQAQLNGNNNNKAQLFQDEEERGYFVRHQNHDLRQKMYLTEYDHLSSLKLQEILEKLKTDTLKSEVFEIFCQRKLISIIGVNGVKDFPVFLEYDYTKNSLLSRLATDPKDNAFFRSFIDLAFRAFLLHRLAFSFHPPARIFRYMKGVKFDPVYMEPANPLDDDVDTQELVVGLFIVPGFQVINTIIKSTVYLVSRSSC